MTGGFDPLSDYLAVFPPKTRNLYPALPFFTKNIGKDGADVVVPIFGSDNFVGQVLSGKWEKYDNPSFLDSQYKHDWSGSLNIIGRSNSLNTYRDGWITSKSKVPITDDFEFDVHMKVPTSGSINDNVLLEFLIHNQGQLSSWPLNATYYFSVRLYVHVGGYGVQVYKELNGANTLLLDTSATNNEGTFRVRWNHSAKTMTVFFHDGSGDVDESTDEVDESPFGVAFPNDLNVLSPTFLMGTEDNVVRTVESEKIVFTYKNGLIPRFDLPIDKPGIQEYHKEAENCTLGSGADTIDLDDDSGTSARLNAQNEYLINEYASVTKQTFRPGRYLCLVRAKDTHQVTNDFRMSCTNAAVSYLNIEHADVFFTLTNTFRIYGLVLDIKESDIGDDLRIPWLLKSTATTNAIYIDWIKIIPFSDLNNGCKMYDDPDVTDAIFGQEDYPGKEFLRVFDPDHEFKGNCCFRNGHIHIYIDSYNAVLKFYHWDEATSTWIRSSASFQWMIMAPSTTYCETPFLKKIVCITSEKIVVEVRMRDDLKPDDDYYVDLEITLRRGVSGFSYKVLDVYPLYQFRHYTDPQSITQKRFNFGQDNYISDNDLGNTTSNTDPSNNYIVELDDTPQRNQRVIYVLACDIKPTQFQCNGNGIMYMYHFEKNEHPTFFLGIHRFSRIFDLFLEAEDGVLSGGASVDTGLGDDSGDSVKLDAQNEIVYYQLSSMLHLPLGRYLFFVRAKDLNQVANDMRLYVENPTDSTYLNEENTAENLKTLTANFAYYSCVFDVKATDLQDTIRFFASKRYATTNSIWIDYFLIIPISNGEDWVQDMAHSFLRRVLQSRMVKQAE